MQDYCGDNKHQHQGINTSVVKIGSGGVNSGTVNNRRSQSGISMMSSSGRRKSSLSYQSQLQLINKAAGSKNSAGNEEDDVVSVSGVGIDITSIAGVGGRYSPHPNEMFLNHHTKLSIQPIDRYDESLNSCCLPPPSPAPNSDRCVVGLSTGSGCGATNGSCGAGHMKHASYAGYEQPHQTQSLSSSTSTSSLSTSSVGGGVNGGMPPLHKYMAASAVALQSTISPSSRFRISDRYREMSVKCGGANSDSAGTENAPPSTTASSARFASSTHFLTQNKPLGSSDTYNYLSSTVHTPVKRYVPTPPPTNELYADIAIPPPTVGTVNNKKCGTLPYRLRMSRCCAIELPQQQQQVLPPNTAHIPHHHHLEQHALSVTDYYATSPRTRTGCTSGSKANTGKDLTIIMEQQQLQAVFKPSGASTLSSSLSTGSSGSSSASSASSALSPVTVGDSSVCPRLSTSYAPPPAQRTDAIMLNDYISPNVEYINSTASGSGSNGRAGVVTSIDALDNNGGSSSNANSGVGNGTSNASTCLHCNTVRRTTGVHQTTQTTGPVSPIPLQPPQHTANAASANYCLKNNLQAQQHHEELQISSAKLTTSTSDSNMLPLSPAATQLQASAVRQVPPKVEYSEPTQLLDASGYSVDQQQPQQHQAVRQFSLQPLQTQSPQQQQLQQQQQQLQRYSRKKRFNQYLRKELARFFGVELRSEAEECALWHGRQRRLAFRRFGALKSDSVLQVERNHTYSNNDTGVSEGNDDRFGCRQSANNSDGNSGQYHHSYNHYHNHHHHTSERPDILPAQDAEDEDELSHGVRNSMETRHRRHHHFLNADFEMGDHVERKASVATMIVSSFTYTMRTLNNRQPRHSGQWSRSFAPAHVNNVNGVGNPSDICDGLTALQEEEVFFDTPCNNAEQTTAVCGNALATSSLSPATCVTTSSLRSAATSTISAVTGQAKLIEHQRHIYLGERVHGWRTSAITNTQSHGEPSAGCSNGPNAQSLIGVDNGAQQQQSISANHKFGASNNMIETNVRGGTRISAHLLDGILENSRRPLSRGVKLFSIDDLDDRTDHRPFFTYWINTVQILVLFLSLVCYGIGPVGIGVEHKTGQVLVTSLSLQTVQHAELRNVWIGPRNNDLVHMGAKFATCMRRDVKIMDVLLKTRRQERETACCIRNDDSGCVQSSQADCSVRGLFPTKSISTWKKWSPSESGPGGRISGSVCGLDPKYCDAPASIAPYEWPDDITKWPICRKTNSFTQRFRYKDHTAEHMVCEVIGHPCCTGIHGECRITTREYCDFVNGYFHEEASLCSQISCLNNVCGMFPFFSVEVPDQFYRLFTSLCLHAGILHLAITVAFQHVFLADLERLIGPIRTAVVYIGSGLAGNLTSAVLVPYKAEVGPLAALSGVVASLVVLLILMHWKQLRKPHIALLKLICIGGILFGIGTLQWQSNFAGLLAGIVCGIFLTIALVPFVSLSKYGRKTKVTYFPKVKVEEVIKQMNEGEINFDCTKA